MLGYKDRKIQIQCLVLKMKFEINEILEHFLIQKQCGFFVTSRPYHIFLIISYLAFNKDFLLKKTQCNTISPLIRGNYFSQQVSIIINKMSSSAWR